MQKLYNSIGILFFLSPCLFYGCKVNDSKFKYMEESNYYVLKRSELSTRAYEKPPYDGTGFELLLTEKSMKVNLSRIKRTGEFILVSQQGKYCFASSDREVLEQFIHTKVYPDLGYETDNIHEKLRSLIENLDNNWEYILNQIQQSYRVNMGTIDDDKLLELSTVLTRKRRKVTEEQIAFIDLLMSRHFINTVGGALSYDTIYTFHPYLHPVIIDPQGGKYSFFRSISEHVNYYDKVDLIEIFRLQAANFYDYEPFTTKHIEFMKTGKLQ